MNAVQDLSKKLFLDSPIGRGPKLRASRRRAFYIWLGVAMLGLLPSLLSLEPAWRAFGLGLWMPGGGFLYTASPHWLVLSLLLFAVSLVLWLIVGGFILPFIVWGGAAVLAALDTQGSIWPWAQVATPLLALLVVARSLKRERAHDRAAEPRVTELKAYLSGIDYQPPATSAPIGEELSDRDLAAMRFTLDLALQPIDQFDGFVTIDQFRESAWRYQLVTINYALGILQTSRMPAFRGYLHEAQRRSIVKMLDRRVWHYWRVENFLGNLRFDADPIKHENIMYSGWWALALGTYERATGDHQFSQPGALTLRESASKSYVYDYPSIVEAMARNFDGDPLCFYPCEPNWVFSVCNLYGMTGMLVFDREHGTRWGLDRLDSFNHTLEHEFTMAEGRTAAIAARRNGFIVTSEGPGAFLTNTQLMNMTSPRLAQTYWALLHHSLQEKYKGDLSAWQLEGGAALDPGNYKKNGIFTWSSLMRSAREMGDEEMFVYARQRYDDTGAELRDGVLHGKGSNLAQLSAHMASFATAGAWYRLAHGEVPAAISNGPVLDDAPYPEVLVARADNDGTSLDLVLCAGTEPGIRQLKLARLDANRRYCVRNSDAGEDLLFSSDTQGNAVLDTFVGKRSRISVIPMDGAV